MAIFHWSRTYKPQGLIGTQRHNSFHGREISVPSSPAWNAYRACIAFHPRHLIRADMPEFFVLSVR
jgi:hypothetical protein